VYTNAAGYLRVCDNGLGEVQLDPFDDTRVHPECYVQNDFAPKICASALVIDHSSEVYIKTVLLLREHCRRELEKNLEGNAAFKEAWLSRGELLELPDKMEQLELDTYAVEVESAGRGKRFRQFEDIKEELRYPWLDRRAPLPACPDESELFSLLTGENDQTVHVGMRLPCSILDLKSRSVDVMTGVGIRGFARLANCSDEDIEDVADVLQQGASVVGVVIAVIKAQFRVEISFRESDVSKDEAYWFRNRNTHDAMRQWWSECRLSPAAKEHCTSMMYVGIDPYFQEEEALRQYTATNEARLQQIDSMQQQTSAGGGGAGGGDRKKLGGNHRAVFHPLFHNVGCKEAEHFLLTDSGAQVGDVVIHPSSSDKDSLIVTWMFLAGRFKHIEVKEANKLEDQGGIGQELLIRGEQEAFSDLDEIFARYIQPMNDYTAELVKHRCYKEFRPDDQDPEAENNPVVIRMSLQAWLNQEIQDNPARIPYCLCPHENRMPGYFQLSWLRNAGHRVYTEYIAIKPEGYRLRGHFFDTPSKLIDWFKESASKTQHAAPNGTGNSSSSGGGGEVVKPRVSRFSSVPPPQAPPPPQHFPPPPPPPRY
jgi:transcription elongation factor SPT6